MDKKNISLWTIDAAPLALQIPLDGICAASPEVGRQ